MELHEQIAQAKKVLKDAGYYVDNLWQIADVKSKFKCTDEEAMEVLEGAMANEATYDQIWLSIDTEGEFMELEEADEVE